MRRNAERKNSPERRMKREKGEKISFLRKRELLLKM
jgi:hypothetical protein